jgi:hypothetical protein
MNNPNVHTWDDCRGNRDVFVNGKHISSAVYADTGKGIVRYAPKPLRLDKYKKRVLTRTLRGEVEVVMR